MIGIRLRGFRHGARLCLGKPMKILYFPHNSLSVSEGVMLASDSFLYVFNNDFRNTSYPPESKINDYYRDSLANMYQYTMCVSTKKLTKSNEFRGNICSPIVLPENFEEQYADFRAANKKMISELQIKIGGSLFGSMSKYIYCLCGGSKNFFSWAHGVFLKGVNIVNIQRILIWNDNYQQMAKNLKKGTITAYNSCEAVNCLLDEMFVLRRNKRVNDTINMFNTAQKKALRDVPYSDEVYNTMSKFNRLSSVIKQNFIRKMSTVDDPNEIIKQMSFVADVQFKWDKESLMEYVANNKNLSCKLFYDNGNIVIFEVKDYDTVKRLAKNTNWCISKNKQYWNNYMSDAHIKQGTKQYVMFDFSKKEDDFYAIVGFTVTKNRGITASHNFINDNILDKRFNMTEYLKRKFETLELGDGSSGTGGIHRLLTSAGVDINKLLSAPAMPYAWNSDSFIEYLNRKVGTNDYDILSMDNNRIVVLVESPNIHKFLGEYFKENFGSLGVSEYIIFADFNMEPSDSNKLLFGRVEYNASTHEASINAMYNYSCEMVPVSFDSLLEEYGLPYDIICRGDNISDRVISSICNFDWKGLNTALSEAKSCGIKSFHNDKERVYDSLKFSFFKLLSTKFLEIIYNNGYTLSHFISEVLVNDMLGNICVALIGMGNMDVYESDFDDLINKRKTDKNSKFVALCYIFKKISENENQRLVARFFAEHPAYVRKCKFVKALYETYSKKYSVSKSRK